MPYQSLLDGLVRSVEGAQSALLLDSEGELVVEAGERDYRFRLIGAYQGLALATAERTTKRYEAGAIRYIHCRYAWGHVILRPLKDGYYLIISLVEGASVAKGIHRSAEAQERMNAEL
jgi:predicted regulator of Ras-like GTPase activity (Roadblock/LC7/MglB family)